MRTEESEKCKTYQLSTEIQMHRILLQQMAQIVQQRQKLQALQFLGPLRALDSLDYNISVHRALNQKKKKKILIAIISQTVLLWYKMGKYLHSRNNQNNQLWDCFQETDCYCSWLQFFLFSFLLTSKCSLPLSFYHLTLDTSFS